MYTKFLFCCQQENANHGEESYYLGYVLFVIKKLCEICLTYDCCEPIVCLCVLRR